MSNSSTTTNNPVHVFGIRHHGAGSANSLVAALNNLQPDYMLIEGPPDADAVIPWVANEALQPPVAILVYNPADLKQAAYYPFAEFSPEWQAMQYAVANDIPVAFMDLPRSLGFTLNKEDSNPQQKIPFYTPSPSEHGPEIQKITRDPLGYIAKIAGYEDGEKWWELTFERAETSAEVFSAVLALMSELRQSVKSVDLRELQREAFMRKTIRQAIKKGSQKIAVVCGAWHAPVLARWESFPAAKDAKLLKGIKKSKTKSTWVPWTYRRISRQSGYGAGVVSPAWYELLFQQKKEIAIRWMSKAATLFRTENMEASSAHIIEAVRLADTLAAMRNLSEPGIGELREAAITVFCQGATQPMELIENRLIIGEKIGEVPDDIPVVPLQQDLNQQIKSARLTKAKKAFDKVEKTLDLRKANHLLGSHLLHRLNLLGIPWGKVLENSQHTKGSFKEIWELYWSPDFAILIIEAGMWGNTVEEAATHFLINQKDNQQDLATLTALVEAGLKADLPEAVAHLTHQLADLSSLTRDLLQLMDAFPRLVNVIRYGSSRNLNVETVSEVIEQIFPRICIGLPGICPQMNEEAAQDVFKKIVSVNHAVHLYNQPDFYELWYDMLHRLMEMTTNGLLVGVSTRILFDKQVIDSETAETYMRLSLSQGNETSFATQWLEGFLFGSGLLLIHHTNLWQILDAWVTELEEERFMEILPILRRTFANFSTAERQKMLQLSQRELTPAPTYSQQEKQLNEERIAKVMPTLKMLLEL